MWPRSLKGKKFLWNILDFFNSAHWHSLTPISENKKQLEGKSSEVSLSFRPHMPLSRVKLVKLRVSFAYLMVLRRDHGRDGAQGPALSLIGPWLQHSNVPRRLARSGQGMLLQKRRRPKSRILGRSTFRVRRGYECHGSRWVNRCIMVIDRRGTIGRSALDVPWMPMAGQPHRGRRRRRVTKW